MDQQQTSLKLTVARFVRTVRIFLSSDVGYRAKLMFGLLIMLLCTLSGLNVVNKYVGRNFMTAIAERQYNEFIRQAIFYMAVFVVLTVVAVFARFAEERLALLWRDFLTRRAVNLYLDDGAYYRLDVSGELTHPDQRIAEDIHAFTVTTLSFVIMLFSSTLTVVTFSGVLWSISPLLFGVAVAYAACGSYVTIALGRPLIGLNHDRLDKEASFRSGLIHLRENAESVMLMRGEGRQKAGLLHRLDDLVANFRDITAVNRSLGFFTGGYNWMIQIVPDLIIAPAFIRGDIEFGVVTQSGAANPTSCRSIDQNLPGCLRRRFQARQLRTGFSIKGARVPFDLIRNDAVGMATFEISVIAPIRQLTGRRDFPWPGLPFDLHANSSAPAVEVAVAAEPEIVVAGGEHGDVLLDLALQPEAYAAPGAADVSVEAYRVAAGGT